MAKLIEKVNESIEGQFLDITPPKFDLFEIKLLQKSSYKRVIKTGEEKNREDDFVIRIDRSKISDSNHKELSELLKIAFGMNFAAYNYESKTFTYYTTSYSGTIEEKKARLQKIFSHLIDFENEYKENRKEAIESFNNEKSSFENYNDNLLMVKYNEKLDCVVVMLKVRVDISMYRVLAKVKSKMGTLEQVDIDSDFFDDIEVVKGKEKKSCFVIPPTEYINIKNFIEKVKENKATFLNNQKEYSLKNKEFFKEYTEENIFDFKLKFDEEQQAFEFYCKGCTKPSIDAFGRQAERSTLAYWAINFILSEEVLEEETTKEDFDKRYEHTSEIAEQLKYKIALDLLPNSSAKDRKMFIPADNAEKLSRIYENFIRENELFSRPVKTLRVEDASILGGSIAGVNLKKSPFIFFDEKGKTFLVYQFRTVSSRKTDNIYLSLKGVQINMKEVDNFLNNHPFSDMIKRNTFYFNSEMWLRDKKSNQGVPTLITEEERESAFNSIYLHASLQQNNSAENKVKKKNKI